ncbi:MAG: hypothetical protein SGI87_10655 [Flavobacteriales bacterium]|nr:hypothetical protein [Flavobacteriales bacterium]
MLTIFGRKKLTTERTANLFVNTIIETVEKGFPDVAGFINDSPEFVVSPNIYPEDYGRFLMIVITGNFNYLPAHFQENQDDEIIKLSIAKLAPLFDMSVHQLELTIKEYKDCMSRLNVPSKNTLYAMSKAVFAKYELNDFQEEYFRSMKTPNPIFLKNLDELMRNFLWNWDAFNEKYKVITDMTD